MDHRGTVYAVTDENVGVQLSYVMDAFGRMLDGIGGSNPNVPNELIYQTNWLTPKVGNEFIGLSPTRILDFKDGRFTERDLIESGLDLYVYVSNQPTVSVDPSGLEISDTPPPDWKFHDEAIGNMYEYLKDKKDLNDLQKKIKASTVEFYTNLKSLRDIECVKVKLHYITPIHNSVKQFAEHASKNNGDCTISYYIGHGETAAAEDVADPEEVKAVKEALGNPKGEGCRRPKYGVLSCYAGSFNDSINVKNRISKPAQNKNSLRGPEITEEFNREFPDLKKDLLDMCKCCKEGVTLHLYFGALAEMKIKKLFPTDFSNWPK